MTELLQTILLRVTIAGAMSAMALKLAGGGALKEVVRTAAGLLMLLALLQPLAGLHVLSWNWQGSVSQSDIDEMQARNMQTTMARSRRALRRRCSSVRRKPVFRAR